MQRAVLMIIDGLRADMVTPGLTPGLSEIASRSRVFGRHRSVFPSATRVNSASIATGCHPARHGLVGNTIALDEGDGLRAVSVGGEDFRDRWRRATGRTLRRPTLAERLRARGGVVIYSNSSPGAAHMLDPDSHGHLYHRCGSFAPERAPISCDAHLDVGYDADGDRETTERLCDALGANPDASLFILWICEPDHSQHAMELGSPEHRDVLLRSDGCVRRVAEAVERLRRDGDDVLFVLGSDHGHETVCEIVPVTEALIDAGFKSSADSSDIVLASSGMGALLFFSDACTPRIEEIAHWLRVQPWTDQVFERERLAEIGLPAGTDLGIAFGMAKREGANRFGIPGLGQVAADPLSDSDRVGCGQHGGLGEYETHPFLIANGARATTGLSNEASVTVDIAPTILRHLGEPIDGMDGRALPLARP